MTALSNSSNGSLKPPLSAELLPYAPSAESLTKLLLGDAFWEQFKEEKKIPKRNIIFSDSICENVFSKKILVSDRLVPWEELKTKEESFTIQDLVSIDGMVNSLNCWVKVASHRGIDKLEDFVANGNLFSNKDLLCALKDPSYKFRTLHPTLPDDYWVNEYLKTLVEKLLARSGRFSAALALLAVADTLTLSSGAYSKPETIAISTQTSQSNVYRQNMVTCAEDLTHDRVTTMILQFVSPNGHINQT